jgi:hypothetical protein
MSTQHDVCSPAIEARHDHCPGIDGKMSHIVAERHFGMRRLIAAGIVDGGKKKLFPASRVERLTATYRDVASSSILV